MSLAADPEGELNRTLVSARVRTGPDGMKRTELVTSDAADRFWSAATLFSDEYLRNQLTELVLVSPIVPARKDQRAALTPLLDAFLEGLGSKAAEVLSANLERAGARLVRLVEQEQRRFTAKPQYDELLDLKEFNPPRATDISASADRHGSFFKSTAYEGWQRSLYALEWFDSRTERTVANVVDGDENVKCWVRLHTGELPILWSSAGQQYNPDLIVVENDGTHWVVEVKMNKEMTSADVLGKRDAAIRWANTVTANDSVGVRWRYLLVSESDVDDAKGSWSALKKLGS
jgi:type III restriction enzyme